MSGLDVRGMLCEYLVDPLAVDVQRPRLTWAVSADRRGAAQSAYRIEVASSLEALEAGGADLWDSGRVDSSETVNVAYGGEPLDRRSQAWWRVTVWDEQGRESAPSQPARWETGIDEWAGDWIGLDRHPYERQDLRPSPQLRHEFALDGPVGTARLYLTALGLVRAWVNGQPVSADRLVPGWTHYEDRVEYRAYDVARLLREGPNAIGLELGDGWYCGYPPYFPRHNRKRDNVAPRARAQLEVTRPDGERQTVSTDGSWRGRYGPIVSSDLFWGETHDARQQAPGWTEPGFGDQWGPVLSGAATDTRIVAAVAEPVRVTQEVPAVAVTPSMLGTNVFDLGQNIVGWVRLKVKAFPGAEFRLRHGEMLDTDGSLYTTNLWDHLMQTDRYVCASSDEEVWEPAFTVHGFRYVEVTGLGPEPPLDTVTGIVAHTDMERTLEFSCSNEMLNKLQDNIAWTMRGNYLEVPTDCPQRYERLGWMGDAQLFSPTACFNYRTAAFYTRWLKDVRALQTEEGAFGNFAPTEAPPHLGAPGWADAGVIIPWMAYRAFGDVRLLDDSFDSMCAWVDLLERESPDGIRRPPHAWGDWLAVPPEVYEATKPEVLGTLYFAHSSDLLSRIAGVLGRDEQSARYAALRDKVREAFVREFVETDGRILGDTQTVYALALRFEVLPDDLREAAAGHLLADIARRDGHLSTGIVGTSHLLHALSGSGHADTAHALLTNETYPSWGFSIAQGATTIWERWDGWTPEAGFQTPSMNSFNHYALGAVGAWMYEHVAGIAAAEPGWARVAVRPLPGGGLTHASASYLSLRGPVSTAWRTAEDGFHLEVTVPANVSATVELPVPQGAEVFESGRPVAEAEGVQDVEAGPGTARVHVASGTYAFAVR